MIKLTGCKTQQASKRVHKAALSYVETAVTCFVQCASPIVCSGYSSCLYAFEN